MADPLEPIHRAALGGRLASIYHLISDDGARLNAQVQGGIWIYDEGGISTNIEGCTPLMLAAYLGHGAVVARLLGLGADKMARGFNGAVDAHLASASNHPLTLAKLLDAGTPLDVRDDYGNTLLHEAAYYRAPDCVALLLPLCGPDLDVDARNNNGRTALHAAAQERFLNTVILEQLLHAGADPTMLLL